MKIIIYNNKMESPADLFHQNPNLDPKTGEPVIIGSRKYKQLTKKYGDVKIKSPDNTTITVGKGTWKKLLKQGYTQEQLLVFGTKTDFSQEKLKEKRLVNIESKVNKNVINNDIYTYMTPDITYNIMLNTDYPDLNKMCTLNKNAERICKDEQFWKDKITRDFPFMPTEDEDTIYQELYKQLYELFDKHTLKIIKKFIQYRSNYNNLQDVYNKIFTNLVNYINDFLNIDIFEDEADDFKISKALDYDMLDNFFNILSIPIKNDEKHYKKSLVNINKYDKWSQMKLILSDMVSDYLDQEGF